MRRASSVLSALLLPLLAAGCGGGQEEAYPPLVTDLADVRTGAGGTAESMTTDNGATYSVARRRVPTASPDTLLRLLCTYALPPDAPGTADVYRMSSVISQRPAARDKFHELPRDPVRLYSAWSGSRYINACIGILTAANGTPHAFSFSEDSTTTTPDGQRVVHVSLLHRRPAGDAENFTRKSYLSLPIYPYSATADSVVLRIATYDGTVARGHHF